jgi:predicted  nucleic acid-binding Zn-ribbon protein
MLLPIAQIPEALAATATAANDTGIDAAALAKSANGNPVMLLAMAAVALLGGKKVWEIVQKRQEAAHEEKMAQIEASKSVHAECQAKQNALQEQVASMARVVQSLEERAKAAENRAVEVVQKAESRVGELEAKFTQVQQQVAAAEAKVKKAEKAAKAKAKANAQPAS